LSDVEKKEYHTVSLIDRRAPEMVLKRLKKGELIDDPLIRKATMEVLKKGNVPLPDELLKKEAKVYKKKLHLDFDGNTFTKLHNGSYKLHLKHGKMSVDLIFIPQKPAVRHGENGIVRGIGQEDMFYYFIPRCEVKGTFSLEKEKHQVKKANGWYDHEFGCAPSGKKKITKLDVAWNWIAIQLDNGFEFTAYQITDRKINKEVDSYIIMIDKEGNRYHSKKFYMTPGSDWWCSTRTFNEYPTTWQVEAPEFRLNIKASAAFPNQEFNTMITKPAFWEGRMKIEGTFRGKKIHGTGYLERNGFVNSNNIKDFLKAVSKATLNSVKKIIPLELTQEKLEELVSKKGNKHFTDGLDKEVYIKKFIQPIRDITDRSGKSWRSYATVACCDAVGGNSQVAIDWLALPELMHVGSLMVDDVQDKSLVRRGGPAAHIIHGDAIAINSGTAAYFLGQICIYNVEKSFEEKVQIYNWYFESMRASHSGQALDIYGLSYMMPQVLKDQRYAKLLMKRVIAIHRLKSAAPASYLARIGVLLGKGTPEQAEAMGNYFETLGIAFQIIDDTLNLKGFKDNLKTKAEDITAGKITYPIAKAMTILNKTERERLWNIVNAKTDNLDMIAKAVAILDQYGIIEMCEKEARQMLERAWKKIDPLLPDSMVKINLRAFSWFVLERTY
jgi:geranylgeranyl pyrophosphate synthase